MGRRLRLLIGVFVVGLSVAALLTVGIKKGVSRESAVVLAFFVATIYAGWQLLRANWKVEREHQVKLARLLDEVKHAPPPSDRPGGADAGDQERK